MNFSHLRVSERQSWTEGSRQMNSYIENPFFTFHTPANEQFSSHLLSFFFSSFRLFAKVPSCQSYSTKILLTFVTSLSNVSLASVCVCTGGKAEYKNQIKSKIDKQLLKLFRYSINVIIAFKAFPCLWYWCLYQCALALLLLLPRGYNRLMKCNHKRNRLSRHRRYGEKKSVEINR